jgi:apolipoprotein N-acyltransferase
MGCFLALLALISPRLVLVVLAIFSNVLSRAFDSWIIPLLGFFLLPWTTLSYAAFWDWGPGHHVVGIEWFFIALAFFIDLSAWFGGQRARR